MSVKVSFVQRLFSEYTLLRVLYMLLFILLTEVCLVFLAILVPLQLLIWLLIGERSQGLSDWASSALRYLQQCLAYLLLLTEKKPFPFSDWPAQMDEH